MPKDYRGRPQSEELVSIPKRVLVELYSLVLDHDEAVESVARARIEVHANRRTLEEILDKYVPGLVLEIMLRKHSDEPTPHETPEAKDIEKSRKT